MALSTTTDEREREVSSIYGIVSKAMSAFKPPEDLTLSQWADKYRYLSPEASAEPGPWRTSRTPYLKEVMDAFTDSKVKHIVMVASSQVGKTEVELNAIGRIIHQEPGPVLLIHPTEDVARDFSRERIEPMLRDTKVLSRLIKDKTKGRNNTSTVLQKSFPGGMLTIIGSNSPSKLASKPIRYVIGDERDRWAKSAGTEGDPWSLAVRRTTTFHNAKLIEVSTPTIKGASAIDDAYQTGTRERWCHRCPDCGEYSEIVFDDLRFKPLKFEDRGEVRWDVEGDVEWMCPKCGCLHGQSEMHKQPAKWIAGSPEAYEEHHIRSFWLTAFASPWVTWKSIVISFLSAKDDPQKLQVVYNTQLGQLWENRGDLVTENEMLARREDYGRRPDGSPVQLPDDVLVLTCGVDVQDNRLEYEIVGHGLWGETWGIQKGIINGRPDESSVWQRLDAALEGPYYYLDGRTAKVSMTCVDSGGHFTDSVYAACRVRQRRRVVAIKGRGGEGVPYIPPPSRIVLKDNRSTVLLWNLGVDTGKQIIMDSLEVQTPGPNYSHFPLNPDAGYDYGYFSGLLSEHLVMSATATKNTWRWEKLPGHVRNEALDCRNYALAALKILNPPLQKIKEQRLRNPDQVQPKPKKKRPAKKRANDLFDSW